MAYRMGQTAVSALCRIRGFLTCANKQLSLFAKRDERNGGSSTVCSYNNSNMHPRRGAGIPAQHKHHRGSDVSAHDCCFSCNNTGYSDEGAYQKIHRQREIPLPMDLQYVSAIDYYSISAPILSSAPSSAPVSTSASVSIS